MKNSKIAKFGIVSLAAITLSVVAPVVAPVTFGINVVYAEEQKARTLNVMDRPTDRNGIYLPDVDLGLGKLVNVTPEKPYIVNQPEIAGWESDGAWYTKADSFISKTVKNGEQITYDDLFEDKDNEGTYGGILLYVYKKSQPASDKPAEPQKPAEKPAEEPQKPAEKPQNQERYLANGYIISGGVERPEGLTSETGTVQTTVTLRPGESYTFPNVTAPGYTLLGVYDRDKNLGVGGTINYDDIPYDSDAGIYTKTVYYIYEPSKAPNPQPETPAEKPSDKPAEPAQPEVPATKPETPAEKPSDKPAEQPTEEPAKPAQPEVPATKPGTPAEKPSVKPAEKPTTPVQPETPAEQPQTQPEVPATKPDTPAEKPSDNPAEKPAQQTGTAVANAQTPAPKADAKAPAAAAPKVDKPAEKKMETLPNTGESNNSIFLALGALLAFVTAKLFSFRKKS